MCVSSLPRAILGSAVREILTRDLSVTSQMLCY